MSNNNAVGSRVLLRIFFAVLIMVSGIASCGGGGGSSTANTTSAILTTYTITASVGSGGTITPSGATTVTQGATQSYTITPNTGYIIATLIVDGNSVATSSTRAFTNVQADHTISATFSAVPTYTITASAGNGGIISPSGATTVTQGATQSYTITPNTGYIIASLMVDGTSVSTSTSRTFTNVQSNHSISATFSVATTYTITASAGPNGSVTPSGVTSVTQGTSQSYTITPNPGYTIATLQVDGVSVATSTTHTFTNVQANHTISATYSVAPAGNLALSLMPARTSGVAPLAVFFDATATTDTGVTSRPFHDLEYRWNFGDSNVGTWAYGAQPGVSSKNSATGPVTAHVFETPGTYTVSLTVVDGTNSATTNTTITVQDPNLVFAGTNTVCISATSVPTQGQGGCPSGAATALQANFVTAINNYATTGKRVLLKRGDTFTAATTAMLSATGPGILGAYGSGAKPMINMTGNTDTLGFGNASATGMVADLRVMDLAFDGGGTSVSHGIGNFAGGGGITQVTALRLDFTRFETSIGFGAENLNWANNQNSLSHTIDQLAVVECTTTYGNNTSYAGYNSGNRVAFMGNHFDNGGIQTRYDENNIPLGAGTHVLRFPFLNRAVISNNDILRPGGDRLNIKLHAPFRISGVPDTSDRSNYSTALNGDGYTKYVIIADNKMVSAQGPWQVTISPQDSTNDERLHDVILERNVHVGTSTTQIAQILRAREITSRNNVFLAGSANYSYFAQVSVDGGEPPASNVSIYNNTMYKSGTGSNGSNGFTIVDLPDTRVSNVTIKNNLGYAPVLTGSVPYLNAGIAGFSQSSNSTTAQINSSSPLFSATDPEWTPLSGSYAINGGSTVPVWSDFYRNSRPLNSVVDIGAVEVP